MVFLWGLSLFCLSALHSHLRVSRFAPVMVGAQPSPQPAKGKGGEVAPLLQTMGQILPAWEALEGRLVEDTASLLAYAPVQQGF